MEVRVAFDVRIDRVSNAKPTNECRNSKHSLKNEVLRDMTIDND